MRRPRRLALSAAALCLLTACTPATPTTSPTPAPSYRCTPEAGGAEYDCSQAQYDEMVAKDKLYAEAEAVYRKFFAEEVRIYRAGGINEPTQTLLDTSTGKYLEDSMALYRSMKESRTRIVGGEIDLVSLTRVPGVSKAGSVVSLDACIDTSSAEIRTPGEAPEKGYVGIARLYFGQTDEAIKIQNSEWKAVDAC